MLYVLVRCRGDGATDTAIELLDDLKTMGRPEYGTDIKEIAAAFVFDADDSLAQREATFVAQYAGLLDGLPPPTHGTWVKDRCPIGLYVFHDEATKRGTLEEIVAPLVEAEWGARWKEAGIYLSNNAVPADPVSTKRSELLKAQINVTGQFLFPGDPMSVVIGKPRRGASGLSDEHFAGQESQSLVTFLQGVPW